MKGLNIEIFVGMCSNDKGNGHSNGVYEDGNGKHAGSGTDTYLTIAGYTARAGVQPDSILQCQSR